MKVLYSTSTGNCLMVAKKFGKDIISIPKTMRKEEYEFEDDKIGIVFPVYGLSVPPLIIDFISKAKFKTDYLFAILTYRTYDAGSVNQLVNIAKDNNIIFNYINCLHMQENYLPGFAMEKQKQPKDQEDKLHQICLDISNRKEYIKKNSIIDRFMTKTHQVSYHYSRGEGMTKDFIVSESCVGCGICKKVCPTNNIHIVNEKPIFRKDCLSCLACVQNCPQKVILLKKEKGKGRYRNPNIELQEIIDSNE